MTIKEANPTNAGGPQRRISVEARKAETKLIHFENARRFLIHKHAAELEGLKQKRLTYIDSLPADVSNMMIAGGVFTEEELADAREAAE